MFGGPGLREPSIIYDVCYSKVRTAWTVETVLMWGWNMNWLRSASIFCLINVLSSGSPLAHCLVIEWSAVNFLTWGGPPWRPAPQGYSPGFIQVRELDPARVPTQLVLAAVHQLCPCRVDGLEGLRAVLKVTLHGLGTVEISFWITYYINTEALVRSYKSDLWFILIHLWMWFGRSGLIHQGVKLQKWTLVYFGTFSRCVDRSSLFTHHKLASQTS